MDAIREACRDEISKLREELDLDRAPQGPPQRPSQQPSPRPPERPSQRPSQVEAEASQMAIEMEKNNAFLEAEKARNDRLEREIEHLRMMWSQLKQDQEEDDAVKQGLAYQLRSKSSSALQRYRAAKLGQTVPPITDKQGSASARSYKPVPTDESPEKQALMDDTDSGQFSTASDDPASREYVQILQNAQDEFEFQPNLWAASTFVIVKDFGHCLEGQAAFHHIIRVVLVLLALGVHVSLQSMWLYWIQFWLLPPNMKVVQNAYKEFHMISFESGDFDLRAFKSLGPDREQICEMALSSGLFMKACIFTWAAFCIREIRQICHWRRQILSLPSLPSGMRPTEMIYMMPAEPDRGPAIGRVVCLTGCTRFLLVLLILLPRLAIIVCHLIIGSAFLTSSTSLMDAIINSLVLTFVMNLNELLFLSFLPSRVKIDLSTFRVYAPTKQAYSVKRVYGRSIVILVLACLFVMFWLRFQHVVPGYEFDVHQHCRFYWNEQREFPCQPFEEDCFPKSRL